MGLSSEVKRTPNKQTHAQGEEKITGTPKNEMQSNIKAPQTAA